MLVADDVQPQTAVRSEHHVDVLEGNGADMCLISDFSASADGPIRGWPMRSR
jgi:hypothetical protein